MARLRGQEDLCDNILWRLAVVVCLGVTLSSEPSSYPHSPKFSWDFIPQFIHCSNNSGPLNEQILQAMTASQIGFVVIEKYQCLHCSPNFDRGETKELAAAKAIKAIDPTKPVFFYFAVDYARTWYELGRYFDAHPSMEVHNADGSLATVSSEGFVWHVFDFAVPLAREAWVETLVNASKSALIDGVFIDGYRSPSSWTKQLIPKASAEEQRAWLEGVNVTGQLLGRSMPSGSTLIINPGSEYSYFPGYNAISVEFFDAKIDDMEQLHALAGTLLEVHVYAGRDEGKFNTTLAAFLCSAGEGAFFGAGDSWDTCDSWLIHHTEYTKPLGKPQPPVITHNGTIWTRTFASGTVAVVDTSGGAARTCVRWADGYRTGKDCFGNHPLL